MYVGLYAICVWNWNWWLIQDHFLINHCNQRTHRCSAPVVGLEEYSLGLGSRYSTVRSLTLTWHEWGLWVKSIKRVCKTKSHISDLMEIFPLTGARALNACCPLIPTLCIWANVEVNVSLSASVPDAFTLAFVVIMPTKLFLAVYGYLWPWHKFVLK